MQNNNKKIPGQDSHVTFASRLDGDSEETVILTSDKTAREWVAKTFYEDTHVNLDKLNQLAENTQGEILKILKINSVIQQQINGNIIIGAVYASLISNLETDIKISFDHLSDTYEAETKAKAESLIRQFHEENDVSALLSSSIAAVYTEGNSIQYLRCDNGHYMINTFPLGIAIVSRLPADGLSYALIDIDELVDRLQKSVPGGEEINPLLPDGITETIRANYPDEVYQAYVKNERYAKLDIRRTGLNRFCDMNQEYGLSPVFMAIRPSLILDTFEKADAAAASAKAKKIIHQILRKEVMGQSFEKKGLEEMAYAHKNLISAWENPTTLYTSPPCVEKVEYIEPGLKPTDKASVYQYRSRLITALGISLLPTDGKQSGAAAGISLQRLMKTINKISEQEENILSRWYSIILEENNISQEYCPVPHILNSELLESEMKKDLSELLINNAEI